MKKTIYALFLALCITLSLTQIALAAENPPNPPNPPGEGGAAQPVAVQTATGEPAVDLLILINGKNPIPEGYTPELTWVENGHAVDSRAYDALVQMLADCRGAGLSPYITSSYRTQETQQILYDNKVAEMQAWGYSAEEAKTVAGRAVAPPGTSEHQLGLAVDIVDSGNQSLTAAQENTDAQQWMMENCWNYGFILRYQGDKTNLTGVMYEPWHYRYVGVEPARAMHDGWICLEEYLEQTKQEEAQQDGK